METTDIVEGFQV